MVEFSETALKILENRYLLKDSAGNVIESPEQMLKRVAENIACADLKYGCSEKEVRKTEQKFFEIMNNLEFLPNSPTLMNAGTKFQQLSACFVLPVYDNLDSIFSAIKNTALIHQTGGGTGFNFSNLRPKNDLVRGIPSAAGPIGFMKIFDVTTDVIKQGGKRRGANMGILNIDHPDIIDFITIKSDLELLKNFNLSVAITDEFMNQVINNGSIDLINPKTGKKTKSIEANKLFNLICLMSWTTGDPGIIFIDTINKNNPLRELGNINCTNPCGEVPLYPYEACNLGSINLSKLVKNNEFDYQKLKELVHIAVHFLDNVIDMSQFPIKEITEMVQNTRKIGLGVMGFADLLFQLQIPYNSEQTLKLIDKIMNCFKSEAIKASAELAEEKGPFPFINKSIYKDKLKLRNATLLSIAPTGTISMLAGCSSGIEPIFGLAYKKQMLNGQTFPFLNIYLEKALKELGLFSKQILDKIYETGSIRTLEVPTDLKKVFVTAMEIEPMYHIKIQAKFQEYVDNSISKTINLPMDFPVEQVRDIFIAAWKLGCKGITIYRYGSRQGQILTFGTHETKIAERQQCPECKSDQIIAEKACFICKDCGYSKCNL